MKVKSIFLFFLFTISFGYTINASIVEPFFNQNFSNPISLNPSYAGSLGCSRIVFFNRIADPFNSNFYYAVGSSYDKYVPKLSGGLAIQYLYNTLGEGAFSTQFLNAAYAFHYRKKDWIIRPAINISVGLNSVDISYPPSSIIKDDKVYFNMGLGLLISKKNLVAGFSIDHLNNPNAGLGIPNKLPTNLKIHANYLIKLNTDLMLIPSLVYHYQYHFNLVVPACVLRYKNIKFGVSYQYFDDGVDAITGMVGFVNDNMSIGYSYNYNPTSQFSADYSNHELTAIFKFSCNSDKGNTALSDLTGF